MMLNIFLCVYLPSICFLWWNVCLGLLSLKSLFYSEIILHSQKWQRYCRDVTCSLHQLSSMVTSSIIIGWYQNQELTSVWCVFVVLCHLCNHHSWQDAELFHHHKHLACAPFILMAIYLPPTNSNSSGNQQFVFHLYTFGTLRMVESHGISVWDWLFSLSLPFRSIHVVAYINNECVEFYCWVTILWYRCTTVCVTIQLLRDILLFQVFGYCKWHCYDHLCGLKYSYLWDKCPGVWLLGCILRFLLGCLFSYYVVLIILDIYWVKVPSFF